MRLVKRVGVENWSSEKFQQYFHDKMLAQGIDYIPFAKDEFTVSQLLEWGYNKHEIKLLIDYLTSKACKYPKVKNFYVLSTSYVKFIHKNALRWKLGG